MSTEANKPGGLFTDPSGKPSTMRGMSWCSLTLAAVWGTATVFGYAEGEAALLLVGTAFVGAFAPKAVQSFTEQRFK